MTRENLQDLIQSKSSSHRVYATQDVTPTRNPNGEPFLTFCTCFASGLCLYLRLQLLFYVLLFCIQYLCSHMYPIGYREEAEKSR